MSSLFLNSAFSGLSIHKIQAQRPEFKDKSAQDISDWIVNWFNESSTHKYAPITIGSSWQAKEHNGFELRVFGCEKVVEPHEHSLKGILRRLEEVNNDFTETTWHFVCFMWKAVKAVKASSQSRLCCRTFALTTGEGYKVVKRWSDYSFPLRVALRIADPSMLVVESKPLVGRKGTSVDTYRKPYQLRGHELETLWRMFTFFQATIKRQSSFYQLEPFKEHQRDISFQVGHGKVQINRDLTFNQITHILGLFEEVDKGNPTRGVDGEEEVDDSTLKYLKNIVRADSGLVPHLDTEMFKALYSLWQNKPTRIDPTLVHRLYRDYIRASSFILIFRGPKYTFFSSPSFADILSSLRLAFREEKITVGDAEHFATLFEEVNLRFGAKSFPLKDFIECELPYREGNYFRNDGMWLEVAGEHLMALQSDFYTVCQEHQIKKGTEGWLEHSWTAKEEWIAFTVGGLLEEHKDFTRKEIDNCIKVLQGQNFRFVSEKGEVELAVLTPCLLKELRKTDRKKVEKSWEDLKAFLSQKKRKKEVVTAEALADFFDDKKDGVVGRGKRVLEELQKERPVCTALSVAKAAGIKLVPFLDKKGMVLRTNFEGVEIKTKKGKACIVLIEHRNLVISELERAKKAKEPFNPQNLIGKKQVGAKKEISQESAKAAFRALKEGLRKSETKSDYWYVVQGPVPKAAPALSGINKALVKVFVEQYDAYKSVDIGEENYNRSYGACEGYLVGDQLFPGRWEYVELFDILRKVGDKLYLYHVKEGFGQKTGDACNQIRDAAHLIRSARADEQYAVFYELYDKAMKSSSETTFHKSTKKELESYGREGFVDLFRNTKPSNIVFVYAFVDAHKKEVRLEEEPDPTHAFQAEESVGDNLVKLTVGDLVVLKSDKFGFLDEQGKRTVKFLRATKEAFVEKTKEQFADPGKVYDTLAAKSPRFVPMKAKVQILHTVDYLKESHQYEFGFAICQIDRRGNPAAGAASGALDEDISTSPRLAPQKFEYEGKKYQRGQTEGSMSKILAQILGLQGEPNAIITWAVYALVLESADVKILESERKNTQQVSLIQRMKRKFSIETEDAKSIVKSYVTELKKKEEFSALDLMIGAYLSDTPWEVVRSDPEADLPYVRDCFVNETGQQPPVVSICENGEYTTCIQVQTDAQASTAEGAYGHLNSLMQKPLGFTGITNSGTDCFLSAVLQVILRTSLIDIFIDPGKLSSLGERSLCTAFQYFAMEYRLCNEQKASCTSPKVFRELLKFPEGQQDASEVLSKLAEHFDLSDMEVVFQVTKTVDRDAAEPYQPKTQGFSQLSQDNTLPCEERSEFPLILEIPGGSDSVSLENCLQAYLDEGSKDGEKVIFEDGEGIHFSSKVTSVKIEPTNLPHKLFVVLRRFNSLGKKDSREVDMGEDLQFRICNQGYQLMGFISHIGGDSLSHGHYVSYWKDSDGWRLFDDKEVKKQSLENIVKEAKTAYVLCFSKVS